MKYMVYTLRDVSGAALYVGATVRGERRIEEHRRHKSWFREVAAIDRESYETAKETSIRENQLIVLLRPRYNGRATAYGHVPIVSTGLSTNGRMTTVQMARRIGVSPDSLRAQINRGILKAEKIGRDWFIADEEAKRYMAENAGKRGTRSPLHPGTGGRPRKQPGGDA